MLSKKYYIALADLIRNSRDYDQFILNLIDYLKQDNPKFDEGIFRSWMLTGHANKELITQFNKLLHV